MIPRNFPCPCNSGKKVKHRGRSKVRTVADFAAVLMDKGLSEARCYTLIRLGKWDGLTAEDRLQVMRWEVEFEESADKKLAIKERE